MGYAGTKMARIMGIGNKRLMTMDCKNYWSEFEYNKLKLLLNKEKVDSILDVAKGVKKQDKMFPISVELHLTDICNLNCEWCTDKKLRCNGATLDMQIAGELFSQLGRYKTGVTLEGGGEPTLHPHFREILLIGRRQHVHMGLISNGTVDISDCIGHLKWMRVSLDSSTREEYIKEKGVDRFDRVMNNLKKCSKARDPKDTYLGIGYVLTNRNQGNLLDLIKELDSMGIDYIYLRPVEEAGELAPSLENLLNLRRQLAELTEHTRIKYMLAIADRVIDKNAGLPCIAHTLTSIIHANGDVALCEKRREDNIILGNLHQNTFQEIWESDYHGEISQKLLDAKWQSGCSVCRITGFNMMLEQLENVHTRRFI